MRAILLALGFTIFLAVSVFLTGRFITPNLVDEKKQELLGVLPLVRSALLYIPENSTPDLRIIEVKRVSGLDITVLNPDGGIQATTLEIGKLKDGKFNVGENGQTVFEMVAISDKASFVLSAQVNSLATPPPGATSYPTGQRFAISEADTIIGPFYDQLFTSGLIIWILGLVVLIPLGLFWKRAKVVTKTVSIEANLKPVADAIEALAKKDLSFRLKGEEGGESLAPLRAALNKFMEEMSKKDADIKDSESYIRSRLVLGESERRALQTALGSVDEGILIVDHLGKIIIFNQAMQQISGFASEVVLNKAFTDIISLTRRNGEAVTNLVPRIISTGITEVFPEDIMLKRRDGTLVSVQIKTAPIKSDLRGSVTHAVVLVREQKPSPRESKAYKDAFSSAQESGKWGVPGVFAVHSETEKLPMVSSEPLPASITLKPSQIKPPATHYAQSTGKTQHQDSERLPVEAREELPAKAETTLPMASKDMLPSLNQSEKNPQLTPEAGPPTNLPI